MNSLNKKLIENLFKLRMVENTISEKYSEQEIRCPVHLSIGQEAVAVGICQKFKHKRSSIFYAQMSQSLFSKGWKSKINDL